jgi:hypothetical protein
MDSDEEPVKKLGGRLLRRANSDDSKITISSGLDLELEIIDNPIQPKKERKPRNTNPR